MSETHTLLLGNPHIPVAARDPQTDEVTYTYRDQPDGEGVTTVELPAAATLVEAFTTLTHPDGVVAHQFESTPSWVSCPTWPTLATLVADHYNIEAR